MIDAITLHPATWHAFLLALVLALATTPLSMVLARRVGAIDDPSDERRIHVLPTPRMGGVGVLLAVLVATVTYAHWGSPPGPALRLQQQLIVVLIGATLACLLGAWDDARGMGWRVKLAGQVSIAAFTVFGPLLGLADGLWELILPVHRIDPPLLDPTTLPNWLAVTVAMLWMVALMNMLNFIDGVDGLAAGMSAIVAVTFAIIAASYGRTDVAVLSAATGGAAVGFLRYNFRKGGALVFLGDSGSLLLGYLLAVVSLVGVLKTAAAISLVIPIALLAVPILNTVFVVAKRLKHRQSLATPDQWHLHHRLLNVGFSPRAVAVAFWLWTASLSAVALALRFVNYGNSNEWRVEGLVVVATVAAGALGVTIWLAFVLEILKTKAVRERNAAAAAATTVSGVGSSDQPPAG